MESKGIHTVNQALKVMAQLSKDVLGEKGLADSIAALRVKLESIS